LCALAWIVMACGCGGATPQAAVPNPDATMVVRACAAAERIAAGAERNGETTRERPLFAVRVVVPAGVRDALKGDGEIGVQGSTRGLGIRVLDMASNAIVLEDGAGQCFAHTVRLPELTGEYCVVFGDGEGPATFSFDYAAHMHYEATDGAYDDADSVCPAR
jgi:hypothetical protein